MRSSKGKVAGGYLHIKWQDSGDMATDDKTFIISVDHRELLKPVDASKAVKFCDGYGPLFGRRSLGVSKSENMNENNNVNCATEGGGGTEFYYMKKDE
jgi:hypothetical protein